MPDSPERFVVVSTPAFRSLLEGYQKKHRKLTQDIAWLASLLSLAPDKLGERVPQLQSLALPIYKTRCKDSCHKIGASGGWRLYYAVNKETRKVFLLFLYHKREYENPNVNFLLQKLERAFQSGLEELRGQ